jgi:predicted nuclease of restriction endonuclease-like RecB superfamily
MLPSSLLMHRYRDERTIPKRLALDERSLAMAETIIELFAGHRDRRRAELDEQLMMLEGDGTDYRVRRGLVHLLQTGFCDFETVSPLEPSELRRRAFALSAAEMPGEQTSRRLVSEIAHQLGAEVGRSVSEAEVVDGLYADLKENAVMTRFELPPPEALIHRYNLAQVQGVFYRAKEIVITTGRNTPAAYRRFFRYLKLFGLMATIEGGPRGGFKITIDGPTSLFGVNTRYGTDLAKFFPALLQLGNWQLTAELIPRPVYETTPESALFTLDSSCELVSHYKTGRGETEVERAFWERWHKTKTEWRLQREVELLPFPGGAIIPSFRLVDPTGRSFLLEIVGYWRPEHLRKKVAELRKANLDQVVLAFSERLNLEKAGVEIDGSLTRIVWFKGRLDPKEVIAALEAG